MMSGPLELELQETIICLVLILGTEFQLSAKPASVLNW